MLRRGSSTRSAPSPAPVHYAPASRPCRCSGPRRHARRGPEPTNGSCCLASRALLSGLLRRPLRWIRLRNPFSFSDASICRAVSAVRPHTQSRVVPIQDIVEDLAVVLRRVAHMAPHQLVPTVHVDMVLVTVRLLPASWSTAPRHPFGAALPACPPSAGVSPAFIRAFSSRLLRCLGTATIEASMIWPPIAREP